MPLGPAALARLRLSETPWTCTALHLYRFRVDGRAGCEAILHKTPNGAIVCSSDELCRDLVGGTFARANYSGLAQGTKSGTQPENSL